MGRLRYRLVTPISQLSPRMPRTPHGILTSTNRTIDIVSLFKAVATYITLQNRTGSAITVTFNNGDATFEVANLDGFEMDNIHFEEITISGTGTLIDIVLGIHDINELLNKKLAERCS